MGLQAIVSFRNIIDYIRTLFLSFKIGVYWGDIH